MKGEARSVSVKRAARPSNETKAAQLVVHIRPRSRALPIVGEERSAIVVVVLNGQDDEFAVFDDQSGI